ncbi:MAG: carbon storage regulator [Phycisphaerales bacterium]|nr:carbon storage regulator [Phycisphaerales bacterium]
MAHLRLTIRVGEAIVIKDRDGREIVVTAEPSGSQCAMGIKAPLEFDISRRKTKHGTRPGSNIVSSGDH